MNLNSVFNTGKDCALTGGSIDDCPYSDYEWKEKRSWVLGYIAGIQAIWSRKNLAVT